MRLVVLHTGYTLAQIYDWDYGLTPRQIEYLADGVEEEERRRNGQALHNWADVLLPITAAVSAAFSGDTKLLIEQHEALRQRAQALLEPPSDADREAVVAALTARAAAEEQKRQLGHHPVFLSILGKPLV